MGNWTFTTSWGVILLGLLVWLLAGWYGYQIWRRGGRKKSTAFLEGFRFLIISLLVFTLLKPEFVREIQRTEEPVIGILVDATGSMETRDIAEATNVVTRKQWVAKQRTNAFWKPLEQSAKVVVEEFGGRSSDEESAIEGTDLEAALQDAYSRDRNLKAVLLLTDGDWNTGASPVGVATRYRSSDIPVFSVAVGRESPLPDLVLEQVDAPSYGLLGEQISIPFTIKSQMPRSVETVVKLETKEGTVNERPVVVPAAGEVRETLNWYPREVGETELTLSFPVEEGETLTDNNRQTIRIAVRVETLKVLVVDSRPRWEYRYLRNALERDPGVDMHCLLFHPMIGPGGGRHYLPAFPGTKEQLSRYDVIFLGDVGVGENELTEQDVELIRGLVERQASGLVFIPGQRGRLASFIGTPLEELIPVRLDPAHPKGIPLQNETRLVLTPLGKRHLLTRFDSNEEQNAELWSQLPGFFWSAGVEKSKPGTDVLAVHGSLRNEWGRIPILVTKSQGAGKVLFIGTDSAWRWRRGVEDKYHYRLWSQVVRWMAHRRHLSEKEGIRLTWSPETPELGDSVFLQATVLDASGFPLEKGIVTGAITSPSGQLERVEFQRVEGGWGVYQAGFTPDEPGDYQIHVAAEEQGRELDTRLPVTRPRLEKIGQPVNARILRELASITGGDTGGIESLGSIVQQMTLLPERKPYVKRTRLWSNPWWGALIVLMLGVYWIGRKLNGMI